MEKTPVHYAAAIYSAAESIIKIDCIGGKRWKRNVAKGARIGPWLPADYRIINDSAWREKAACLYLFQGNDGSIRYVGISRNGVKHRWRTSPAYDADTMVALPHRQLFHSQCWKHIEAECTANPGRSFEVRSITAARLIPVLVALGAPLSGFLTLGNDHEGIVAAVERWLCNRRTDTHSWHGMSH